MISPLHRAHGFGVRPASCSRREVADHLLVELPRHLGDLEREPADAGHRLGVGPRGGPAAPVLDAVEMHETHVGADHVVALFREQARRDRRVDPARHRDQHRSLRRHDVKATVAGHAYRSAHDRGSVRRPDGVVGVVPTRGSGRGARGHPHRRGRGGDRRGGGSRPPRALGGGVRRPTRRLPASTMRSAFDDGRTTIRSRGSPWRGSPCSSAASGPMLPEPQEDPARRGPGRRGARRWTGPPTTRAIARIREHIAAGDTYQVNHTLRLRSRVEGDERGLYRDLCYAQRGAYAGYLNTRAVSRALRLARALLPHRRRPHRHQADEGHGPSRAMDRRGRGDRRRGCAAR